MYIFIFSLTLYILLILNTNYQRVPSTCMCTMCVCVCVVCAHACACVCAHARVKCFPQNTFLFVSGQCSLYTQDINNNIPSLLFSPWIMKWTSNSLNELNNKKSSEWSQQASKPLVWIINSPIKWSNPINEVMKWINSNPGNDVNSQSNHWSWAVNEVNNQSCQWSKQSILSKK